MEHRDLIALAQSAGCVLDDQQAHKLLAYARMIESTNKHTNLTGHKSLHEIIERLIIHSIRPFADFSVPRGTIFVDIGTGAGIPGVPLCIYHRTWQGVLVDSSVKKTSFIEKALRECDIENGTVVHGRVEEFARGKDRESFDLGISRAAGTPFMVMEIGVPLIKIGGLFYIYSHDVSDTVRGMIDEHGEALGVSSVPRKSYGEYGLREEGLLFKKIAATSPAFPRGMAVIKRMARRKGLGGYGT